MTLTYAVVLVGTCAALLALKYALLYRSLYTNVGAPSPTEMAATCDYLRYVDPVTNDKCEGYERQMAEAARLRADTLVNTAGNH